mmetsp:Transcript_11587/g.15269  ORF Transcript_11587/g.15269 Transcript_11587/m.15269 type:complete len:492 (+) Transcript_11587:200-1675(+)
MKWFVSFPLFWIVILGCGCCVRLAVSEEQQQNELHPVIKWLQSSAGGYFNSAKVEFRNGGMYAVEDIPKGELVMNIPSAALFMPGKFEHDDDEDDNEFSDFLDDIDNEECAMAYRLAYEYKYGNNSNSKQQNQKQQVHPYIDYVFNSFAHEQLPMAWSAAGKELVRSLLVGDDLKPQHFGEKSFARLCRETFDNDYDDDDDYEDYHEEFGSVLLESALRIVLARGWVGFMVPVFDMVNHRNGIHQNVDVRPEHQRSSYNLNSSLNIYDDNFFEIVATRDIAKGQALANSYNDCGPTDVTCYRISHWYNTPHIFDDYGFVEQYPQRFSFSTAVGRNDNEDELAWEIDIEDDEYDENNSDVKKKYKVTWMTNDDVEDDDEQDQDSQQKHRSGHGGGPTLAQMDWLQAQIQRLFYVRTVLQARASVLPLFEKSNILLYHQALKIAMEQAWIHARAGHDDQLQEEANAKLAAARETMEQEPAQQEEACEASTTVG